MHAHRSVSSRDVIQSCVDLKQAWQTPRKSDHLNPALPYSTTSLPNPTPYPTHSTPRHPIPSHLNQQTWTARVSVDPHPVRGKDGPGTPVAKPQGSHQSQMALKERRRLNTIPFPW